MTLAALLFAAALGASLMALWLWSAWHPERARCVLCHAATTAPQPRSPYIGHCSCGFTTNSRAALAHHLEGCPALHPADPRTTVSSPPKPTAVRAKQKP
jgi:hypothetical protein